MAGLTRDLVVAVFVVWKPPGGARSVLLHRHAKLERWLPPGGHVEPNELPDDAAVRETLEESGVRVRLEGGTVFGFEPRPGATRMLVRPRGVQLETIGPDHEHIDLVYLARPEAGYDGGPAKDFRWVDRDALDALELTDEVGAWCRLALLELR